VWRDQVDGKNLEEIFNLSRVAVRLFQFDS
jgi:hypothetical protein